MPTRHPDLFGGIAEFGALMRATRRAVRGKRGKPGAAAFMAGLETEVLRLERELLAGTWRPGRYVEIEVFEPKHRIVSAAPFRDQGRYHLGRMLEVAIHEDDRLAVGMAQPGAERGLMAEIACECNKTHGLIAFRQGLNLGQGVVGRAVIDKDDLVGA